MKKLSKSRLRLNRDVIRTLTSGLTKVAGGDRGTGGGQNDACTRNATGCFVNSNMPGVCETDGCDLN